MNNTTKKGTPERQYTKEVEEFLEDLAENLQIPQEVFNAIEKEYKQVAEWLGRRKSKLARYNPNTYIQGSFELGTMIIPVAKKYEYDIDLVCVADLDKAKITQEKLKNLFGDELRAYTQHRNIYRPKSKRRCWQLDYTRKHKFHIDVLPAIPFRNSSKTNNQHNRKERGWGNHAVAITDEEHENYTLRNSKWPHSNPKGYVGWFRSRQNQFLKRQRNAMVLNENRAKADKITNYEVKTPLQSAIQILKRHRDMRHKGNPDDKPISIIITTLAAKAYRQETTIAATLYGILSRMKDHIKVKDGVPWVANPTDPQENFADKWSSSEYPRRKEAFYIWLKKAKEDFASISGCTDRSKIGNILTLSMGDEVINKTLRKKQKVVRKRSSNIGKPKHKKEPPWQINLTGQLKIKAEYLQNGFRWLPFHSGGKSLPKNCELRFTADTNATGKFEVFWQVVNTGQEAAKANDLRGDFFKENTTRGRLECEESTLYKGSHTIECFIVKNNSCLARSGEFVVNIL
ncbi:MAG: nucleotidyltransferase [Paracoccaceae bacterium]|nr:nucleotidyltransferase [Paracoccaceae bacterium]MDE2674608.1 nucleotidyltransferase [Paracoccaceae bacterium]